VTKTADAATVSSTDNIGFTITVNNGGAGSAKNVMLSDTLPNNAGLSWSINGGTGAGSCSITSGTLSCNFGTMGSGTSKTVNIASPTTADTCGTVTNSAAATATNEANTGNNSSGPVSIAVQCPDLYVTKTADASPVNAGSQIGFTIQVKNIGPGLAKSVTLSDSLPSSPGMTWTVDPLNSDPTCSVGPGNVLSCSFGNVANLATKKVHVTSPTTPANCGVVNNTATASAANEKSGDTTNNSSSASITLTDNTAPVINLSSQVNTLWSPNHKYVNFKITDFVSSVTDSCQTTIGLSSITIVKVTSDEPENINSGDGNTFQDMLIAPDCKSVDLRAERDGNKNGRVYTITLKATDANGNKSYATVKVTVPHSQGPKGVAVEDPVAYTVTNPNCPY
jgi:uncharacterized repeat protein (TIGR01451 family)